ncbi:MAG: fused MFS/spermidine synthase [Acidimicrobiales bacterium]
MSGGPDVVDESDRPNGVGPAAPVGRMGPNAAAALVAFTSFCVLVMETLAGRLLAPVVGVSLESFTGIIGTVLAAIAAGNAAGGRLADRLDPTPLIGPILVVGGALTWLTPVIVRMMGPAGQADAVTVVALTCVAFFAPAAVLSTISPMVAKVRLDDVGHTGRVVGNLSAAGTVGALVGTFLTGFVLVAWFPTDGLMIGVGAALVIVGAVLTGWRSLVAQPAAVVAVVLIGAASALVPSRCEIETEYACVELPTDPDNPRAVTLVLDSARNSYVDLDDPTHLGFRYIRLLADVAAVAGPAPDAPIEVLHLGGAGFTMPRYVEAVRPGSRSMVLEIDGKLVDVARDHLELVTDDQLQVEVGDARLTVTGLTADHYDLIIADAFSGLSVPWHLATVEMFTELDRVLAPDGIVAVNLIDAGGLDFVRAEIATYRAVFPHVQLIEAPPAQAAEGLGRNLVLVASPVPIPPLVVDPADGMVLSEAETTALAGDAIVLRDDFAPADQLRTAS